MHLYLETTVKPFFYKNLSSITKSSKPNKLQSLGGDFNAKSKSKFQNYPKNVNGKYKKSDIKINSSNRMVSSAINDKFDEW